MNSRRAPVPVTGIEHCGEVGGVAAPGRDHVLAELVGDLVDGDASIGSPAAAASRASAPPT